VSSSPMNASRPGIFLTVACLLLSLSGSSCAISRGGERKTEDVKPAAKVTEPSLCLPYESGSTGYSLRCPKRTDLYRGTNTGLQAAYQIGDAAPKQAEVFQNPTSWLVHIPDRVRPGDKVRVELSFLYAPSDAAREALKGELKRFNEGVVEELTQALREHSADWASHLTIDPKATPYELLKSARSKNDTPAIPTLLKGLGFKQDESTGKWEPTDETLKLLNEAAEKNTALGLLDPKFLKQAKNRANVCSTLLNQVLPADAPKELLDRAADCVEKSSSEVVNESTKAKAQAAAKKEQTAIDDNACKQLFQPLSALANFDENTSDEALVAMSDSLGEIQDKGEKVCPKTTIDQLASARSLVTLTRHVNASRQTEEALAEQLENVAAAIAVTIDLPDSRDQFLEADVERRGYSLSSGATYLLGLNDLVYPVMVSVCPAGCLRGGEQFWAASNGFSRSISFEAGIVAVTADQFDDARKRGGPGFMAGLSWQAVAPFRLSGGTLFFENKETRSWQFDGYLGVTLDAVKAIELMGLFGISVPVQLKSTGSASASKE